MRGLPHAISTSVAKNRADAAYYPTGSWWIGLDQETFYRMSRSEWARMRLSRYGRTETLVNGPEEPPRRWAERKPL